MSSRMIPGNAKAISKLINEMYRIGAEVLYESVHAIHASGHAQREELRDMLEAVRPELFVPVHGEYQHLVKHGRLAAECGVRKDNVILLEDGLPLTLLEDSFRIEQRVPVECTLVDGKGVGDVGYAVLKERRILGDEGMRSLKFSDICVEVETPEVEEGVTMAMVASLIKPKNPHSTLSSAGNLILTNKPTKPAPFSAPTPGCG